MALILLLSTSAAGTVVFSRPEVSRIIGTSPDFLMVASVGLTVTPVRLDHVRPLLRYHDDGGVGVAGHNGRHDGGVDNSQSWNSVHLQTI